MDSDLPIPVIVVWRSPSRHYRGIVQQDLFGQWELLKAWGGNGSLRGGHAVVPAASRSDALAQLEALARRRARRGYEVQEDSRLLAGAIERRVRSAPTELLGPSRNRRQ